MVKVSHFYHKNWGSNSHFYDNAHLWVDAMETTVLRDLYTFIAYNVKIHITEKVCSSLMYESQCCSKLHASPKKSGLCCSTKYCKILSLTHLVQNLLWIVTVYEINNNYPFLLWMQMTHLKGFTATNYAFVHNSSKPNTSIFIPKGK